MRKLIVVSGGSQGIGRAIISKFAAEGFDAVTCARHAADLEVLKMQMEKLYPGSTTFFRQTDMSVKSEVQAFADYVLSLTILKAVCTVVTAPMKVDTSATSRMDPMPILTHSSSVSL